MSADVREQLAEERLALASALEGLAPDAWDVPSLSAGWTVHHVVAHLVMPFRYSRTRVAMKLVRARGDFNRVADEVARRDASIPADELVAILRANAYHPFKPPGAGYDAPLTDLVVHGLDICRPLGIERGLPAETLRIVLDSTTSARSLKFFGVDLTGIGLEATDVAWQLGHGWRVTGSAADLILVLCGRTAGAERLSGEGVAALAGQLEAAR